MKSRATEFGLFVLRVSVGLTMALSHGWSKLANFTTLSEKFPDPIGLGGTASLGLAVFAELGCSLLLVLGLATRLAAVPLLITMGVAFFIVHGGDPLQKRELALMYAAAYATLIFTGGGRISLDHLLARRRKTGGLELDV